MASRKLVSWRIETLEPTERDKINAWLEAQSNIQLSLTNLAMHMIERFGTIDIMKYDVQRALYVSPDAPVVHKPVVQIPMQRESIPKESTKVTVPLPTQPEEEVQKKPVEPKKKIVEPKPVVVQQKIDTGVQPTQPSLYDAFSDDDL